MASTVESKFLSELLTHKAKSPLHNFLYFVVSSVLILGFFFFSFEAESLADLELAM